MISPVRRHSKRFKTVNIVNSEFFDRYNVMMPGQPLKNYSKEKLIIQ